MAFLVDATMKGYRVLGITSGTSKKGKPWRSISLYRDGRNVEVSTSDDTLFSAVDSLHEMDVINLDIRAVAGKERSYILLLDAPLLVQSAVM